MPSLGQKGMGYFCMADFGTRWENRGAFKEGGQAHTFKVVDKDDPASPVRILKRLKNPKRSDRFDQEVQACLVLEHPNILPILDHGVLADGKPYFVTPFCNRGNLEEQQMPLGSPLEVLKSFRKICEGAAYAHSKGVIHRDFKPENIFINEDGVPLIGDFGICLIEGAVDSTDRMTSTMEVMGSRWYCAPELRNGRLEAAISQAPADVYSLAKVLYWMLSGGQMFDREEHRSLHYRLGQNDETNQAYELINELFDRTIVADPTKRLQNASALRSDVDDLIAAIENGGHAISIHVPHRCIFCAQGTYKVVVNSLEANSSADRALAQSLFGWASPQPHARWLIMVCDVCGNVQTFRPDLPDGKTQFQLQTVNKKSARWTTKRNL